MSKTVIDVSPTGPVKRNKTLRKEILLDDVDDFSDPGSSLAHAQGSPSDPACLWPWPRQDFAFEE